MRRFTYTEWSGKRQEVDAERVTFEPSGHVAFWASDFLVRAVRTENCNNVEEVHVP
ncbi:hypothetical protein QDA04_gp05 [Microbacterium phage Megan]|uniref:Uncharacterized protein n=1 Tax=Microbacterium phage Megan TaxID=2656551 RepID=A0A649VJX6_9CAUD|nr:hypothetical protein QDA04_gp05 [Microbacterium phage Megan]QGJ92676.1 hypothetical protein PBI_MEGAN_5 [Microbacterium phage Megan]